MLVALVCLISCITYDPLINCFTGQCHVLVSRPSALGENIFGASLNRPKIQVQTDFDTRAIKLPNNPVFEFNLNKGDLWKINMNDFGFDPPNKDNCVRYKEIKGLAIIDGSIDSWNIDSMTTYAQGALGGERVLSQDFDIYFSVDGGSDLHLTMTK